ncbi:MAG: hypothetical protein ACO1TE_15925 [Prosthecobacter sp.]
MTTDLQIDIRVLKPDGWAVGRSIQLKMPEAGVCMREVMEGVLEDERQRRLKGPPGLHDEASLIQALDTGGTRTQVEGEWRDLPPLSKLLCKVEQSLRDELILVILNGEPWREWEMSCLPPNPSSLWIARTVWLQHGTWS